MMPKASALPKKFLLHAYIVYQTSHCLCPDTIMLCLTVWCATSPFRIVESVRIHSEGLDN
jgi:hypothetical protein